MEADASENSTLSTVYPAFVYRYLPYKTRHTVCRRTSSNCDRLSFYAEIIFGIGKTLYSRRSRLFSCWSFVLLFTDLKKNYPSGQTGYIYGWGETFTYGGYDYVCDLYIIIFILIF